MHLPPHPSPPLQGGSGVRARSHAVKATNPASLRATRHRSNPGHVATSRWALAISIPTQHSAGSGGATTGVAGSRRGPGSSAPAARGVSRPTGCSAFNAAWTAAATAFFVMMCSLSRPCTMRVLAPATVRASGPPYLSDNVALQALPRALGVPEGYRATTSSETLPNFKHTRGICG